MKRRYDEANKWQDLILDLLGGVPDSVNVPAIDPFGRSRVSMPFSLFNSKLLGDNRPLIWDDQETSGGGTGSSYSANKSSVTLSVSDTTAGTRVRQTYLRANYQPGKGQEITVTNTLNGGAAGITKRWGYFDGNNGVFFQLSGTTLSVVIRSNATGTPVDTVVNQSAWNIDPLDGTGISGVTIDTTARNIWYIDFEWLGVGGVRFGMVIGNVKYYCHYQAHANSGSGVYMTTPNLPIRYEISNDGTGAADTFECICCSVNSEGGQEETGTPRAVSSAGTHLSASVADTLYAAIGIRLKSTHLDNVVKLQTIKVVAETNDDFEWQLLLNPTVAGTFTFADQTNSAVQTVLGATANTVTGGTFVDGGWGKSGEATAAITKNLRYMGSNIAGTADRFVLCIRPLANNAVIQSTLTWLEIS